MADWSRIARLKEAIAIPVIGNGDIRTGGDAVRMMQSTSCDGVMIGRAAVMDPWIFTEVAAALSGTRAEGVPLSTRIELVRRHLAILATEYEGRSLLHKLRLMTRWCSRGLPGGRRLRQRLSEVADAEALRREVVRFLDLCATEDCPAESALGEPVGR
jgi:tRNA-dihydrouridine synthase